MLIGHEKGDDTASRLKHNFGMAKPEGCASILWRTGDKAADAAEAMKITAADLQGLGVVDRVISEPLGGAHRDPEAAIGALKGAVLEELDGCGKLGPAKLRAQRRAKYLAIG
jgi:acetyl-CoA carboxylase carboxyl transferase subunit alpha